MKTGCGVFLILTLILGFATTIMGLTMGWSGTFSTLWIGALMVYGAGFVALIIAGIASWLL